MLDAKLGLQVYTRQLAQLAAHTNVLPHLGKEKENKMDTEKEMDT